MSTEGGMMKGIESRVVIVTGAGSGIGRSAAKLFAKNGAKVVVGDMNREGGEETVHEIEKEGGQAVFVHVDVSKSDDVENMVKVGVRNFGGVDLAFNNAGITLGGALHEIDEELWNKVIDINLKGVWLCMKYEIPEMLKRGGGAIVNTASIAGHQGDVFSPVYTASKHGILGLTQSAALQYAAYGIRVNAVSPGIIATPMSAGLESDAEIKSWVMGRIAADRLGNPEEVAEVAVWLCSDGASYVMGHAVAVDGGFLSGPPFKAK